MVITSYCSVVRSRYRRPSSITTLANGDCNTFAPIRVVVREHVRNARYQFNGSGRHAPGNQQTESLVPYRNRCSSCSGECG